MRVHRSDAWWFTTIVFSLFPCVCVFLDIVNTTIDGVAVTVTTFEPTKKMSTYLLAVVVSDFTHINATQGDILVTVCYITDIHFL